VELDPSVGIGALGAVINEDFVRVRTQSNLSSILVECMTSDAIQEALGLVVSISLDRHCQ
jgi:hypothetical protein